MICPHCKTDETVIYVPEQEVYYCCWCKCFVEDNYDPVKNPSHYMHGGLETRDIIKALLTPEEYRGYCKGNIIKYGDRAPYKGNTEQDYAKRKEYYDWLKEVE